jgi:hypothetical protein
MELVYSALSVGFVQCDIIEHAFIFMESNVIV